MSARLRGIADGAGGYADPRARTGAGPAGAGTVEESNTRRPTDWPAAPVAALELRRGLRVLLGPDARFARAFGRVVFGVRSRMPGAVVREVFVRAFAQALRPGPGVRMFPASSLPSSAGLSRPAGQVQP